VSYACIPRVETMSRHTYFLTVTNGLSIRTLIQVAAMGIDVHAMQCQLGFLYSVQFQLPSIKSIAMDAGKTLNCIFPIIWTLRLMICIMPFENRYTNYWR